MLLANVIKLKFLKFATFGLPYEKGVEILQGGLTEGQGIKNIDDEQTIKQVEMKERVQQRATRIKVKAEWQEIDISNY